MRRAAVANVSCMACGEDAAGVVMGARQVIDEKPELIELCLECISAASDVAKVLQLRIRQATSRSRHADYGPDWSRIHDEILNRDGYECQDVDHRAIEGADLSSSLVVHHIKPLKEFGGDYLAANQQANLITLCTVCHGRWHSALTRAKKVAQRQ